MENYVNVQVGCLRFPDSYRFLSSSLDNFVRSINSFPIMQSAFGMYELTKMKLGYP